MADILTTIKLQADQYLAEGKKVEEQMRGITAEEKKAQVQSTATTGELKKTASEAGAAFNKLGGIIAAAFSVAQIISFAKTSIAAFAEAELSVRKLNSALSANGGTQAQLNTLIKQSKELQKTTIFSDEQIQSAQTLALQFGLTATEVDNLIPKIADFASATGQDLKGALEAVLRGSEGVARGLKVYGIEVDSSVTKSTRLTQITEQLTKKFGGQAAEVGTTTTGAFQKLKNAFNDVEESIGELLNKGGGIIDFLSEVTEGLARFFKSDEQAQKEITFGLTEEAKKSALKSLDELKAKFISQGRSGNDAFKVLINESNTIIEQKEKDLFVTLDATKREKIKRDIELEKARISALESVLADEEKARVRGIKEGAEAAAKAAKEAAEQAEKDAKDAFDRQQDINKKSADDTLQIQLANLEKEKQDELAIEETSAQEKLLIDRKYLLQRALLFEDDKVEQAKIAAQIAEIDKKLGEQKLKDASDTSDAVTKQNKHAYDDDVKNQAEAEKQKQENIQATFEAAQNLIGQLMGLLNAQSQSEIESINSRKDAELTAIDEQLAALDDAHSKRKIGDKQYEASKKKLLDQRKADEKRAAEETKRLKQQEAEREKAYTIFSIILSTARAIIAALATVPPNPFLATLAGITGAAELAIAVATPIPEFAKGTKGKKEKGMGLVGEKGAEFMFMPQGTKVVPHAQTKKHSRAVDAMIDDRFEDYVYYDFVLPALQAAQKKKEQASSKTFAENMRDSFSSPQSGFNYYDLVDGLAKNNKPAAEALGAAIAKHLNSGYSNNRYH